MKILKTKRQLMLFTALVLFVVYYIYYLSTHVEVEFAMFTTTEQGSKTSPNRNFKIPSLLDQKKIMKDIRLKMRDEVKVAYNDKVTVNGSSSVKHYQYKLSYAAIRISYEARPAQGQTVTLDVPLTVPNTYCFICFFFRENLNRLVRIKLEQALQEDKGTGCDIPTTDPFAKEIMKFNDKTKKVNCTAMVRDWVNCYMSKCKVDPKVLRSIKDVECVYKDIILVHDFAIDIGPKRVVKGSDEYKLNVSDHVEVRCTGIVEVNSTVSLGRTWKGYGVGFRPVVPKKPPPRPRPRRENTYNVLIFAFDSTSKNGFIRKMPKGYRFLKEELNAVIFNGYNIVGDGTPAALFPILTGKTELELPECRVNIESDTGLDSMPFIFYKLKEYGYRTAYFEDLPWIGTFQFRFTGFSQQPADHYLRAFYTEVAKYNMQKGIPRYTFCVGDVPRYQLMMNLTDQFLQLDGKKFAFTFISDITHEKFNFISSAEDSFLNFMRGLIKKGVLNDTFVIVMGDHGPRFDKVRQTLQGKLEERLPLMAIRLPDSFIAKRPDALAALEHNAKVLTTPHDIHATVLDLLDMTQHWNGYKVKGAHLTRGLTLLKPIPKNRSCSEAGIEAHWCACLKWEEVASNNRLYKRIAQALVDQINFMTKFVKNLCARRTLSSISWVMRKNHNPNMLKFRKAQDPDGFIPSFFNGTAYTNKETYQVKIEVGPGKAVYEAAVTHLLNSDKLIVSTREISRTNR